MICLKSSLKDTIIQRLNGVWPHVFLNKLEKNRNEILFCMNKSKEEMFVEKFSTHYSARNDKNNNNSSSIKTGNTMLFLEEISEKLKEIKLN
jgi:hypothetical protein